MTFDLVVELLTFVDAIWALMLAWAIVRLHRTISELSDRYERLQGPQSAADR